MNIYKVEFIERIQRTDSISSFRFKPEKNIEFSAGQFMKVIFDIKNESNKELNKYLSFSCAPGLDYIEVSKRLSDSNFSDSLRNLEAGDTIHVKAPMGTCTLDKDFGKLLFIIGGIGITPVISILEDLYIKKIPYDAALIYCNRSETDIAFYEKLTLWENEVKDFRIIHVLTKCESNSEKFITGRLNEDIIKETVADYNDRTAYIFGSPGMVKSINNMCINIGMATEKIKKENFIGY